MFQIKVWSGNRQKKFIITCCTEDNIKSIIDKGNKKLQINGTQFTAEEDGTFLTETEDIHYYATQNKPILLLEENEMWSTASFNDLILNLPVLNKSALIQRENTSDTTAPLENLNSLMNGDATQVRDANDSFEESESREISRSPTSNSNNNEQITTSNSNNGEDITTSNSNNGEEITITDSNDGEELINYLQEKKRNFSDWSEYIVPWTQISPDLLEACRNGTTENSVINGIVRAVIGDMRFYNVPIRKQDLQIVAKQFRDKFPKTFEDRGNDELRLDNGYNGVWRKLQEHNNYRNKSLKRNGDLNSVLNISIKSRRQLEAPKSGTTNWQPSAHPEGETQSSLDEKKEFLKSYDFTEPFDMSNGEVADMIKCTYASQRLFINSYLNSPSTNDILNEWPLLFVKNCLFWHFKELTGTSMDTLRTRFDEKLKTILIYGYEKLHCEFKDLSESRQQKQMLNIIQTRFKETEVALLHSCSVSVFNFIVYYVFYFRISIYYRVATNQRNQ